MQRATDAIKSVLPGHNKEKEATAATAGTTAAGTTTSGHTGTAIDPRTAATGTNAGMSGTGGVTSHSVTGQPTTGHQGMTGHTGVAGTGTTSHQSTGISTGTTEEEIRTRVRAPVVHEEIRASEQVRVTPEVQREVVRPEIQQVVQPVTERVQAPTQVEIARAEGGVREVRAQGDVADERRYAQQAAAVRDETRHAGTERSRVEEQARVSETVRGERYQEIQPVIERVVEKPKVVEVQQHQKEIVHEAPKVHDLKVNAPIDISSAAPLLKGQGQAVGPGQYRDYENAPHAPGETKMHPSEKIPTREGHELKESTPRGA